jgi:hypothetical protein
MFDFAVALVVALGGAIRRLVQFFKDEFVDAPVPASVSQRYEAKVKRPKMRMDEAAYIRLRRELERRLTEEEQAFLFLAHAINVDEAYDVGQIAARYGKPLYYVATVLRGAECRLANNMAIRPHLQAILDLRFDDTLDLATTYANLRRPGVAKNLRIALIKGYMKSLSELERAALRICYGSALEACIDVTARHHRLAVDGQIPQAGFAHPARLT